MRRNSENYDYLSYAEIENACNGDPTALAMVIKRYEFYAGKCLMGTAQNSFGLELKSLPLDDLMQEVWIKLIRVIQKEFKI